MARGILTLDGEASIAPVIDPVTSVVDPRLTLLAGVGWRRDAFSLTLMGNAILSVAGAGNQGAQDFVGGSLRAAYQFGDAIGIDTGFRGVWEVFQGQTVLPPTYAVFVGLTFGAHMLVAGR